LSRAPKKPKGAYKVSTKNPMECRGSYLEKTEMMLFTVTQKTQGGNNSSPKNQRGVLTEFPKIKGGADS
jgi:hypothetical protein